MGNCRAPPAFVSAMSEANKPAGPDLARGVAANSIAEGGIRSTQCLG